MSNLGPQQQSNTYDGLLQVDGGVSSTLKPVQDGDGNFSGLWLSSQKAQIGGVASDSILQIPGGVTSSLQTVLDGDGNPTGLQLSSSGASVTTSDTFVPSVNGTQITGAVPRLISDGFGDYVSVKDFGAVGDGITDDTTAIQSAVNSSNGYLAVFFPPGTYKVTSTINFAYDRYYVYGCGSASIIDFEPTANDTLFYVAKTGTHTSSVQNVFRDLTFYSSDTTYTKVALEVVDQSQCLFQNLQTKYPHWYGGTGSTFLHIMGRDTTAVRGLNVSANKPIVISPIPSPWVASGIGIDHFHFSDLYIGSTDSPLVTIETGTNVTHVTFDGYQAWVGGTYGLYWNDTTSSVVSIALNIQNVRWEQQVGTTGYAIYVAHNQGVQLLNIDNLYGALSSNGIYFRKCNHYKLTNIFYTGSQVGLDIDASCSLGVLSNVYLNNASATANIVNKGISGEYWRGGNVVSFIANSPTGSATQNIATISSSLNCWNLAPEGIAIANGATAEVTPEVFYGMLTINVRGVLPAIYTIKGTNHVSVLMVGDTTWFGTSAGSKLINVYYDAVQGFYVIQNNAGGPITVACMFFS